MAAATPSVTVPLGRIWKATRIRSTMIYMMYHVMIYCIYSTRHTNVAGVTCSLDQGSHGVWGADPLSHPWAPRLPGFVRHPFGTGWSNFPEFLRSGQDPFFRIEQSAFSAWISLVIDPVFRAKARTSHKTTKTYQNRHKFKNNWIRGSWKVEVFMYLIVF